MILFYNILTYILIYKNLFYFMKDPHFIYQIGIQIIYYLMIMNVKLVYLMYDLILNILFYLI